MKVGDTVRYTGKGDWNGLRGRIIGIEMNVVGKKTIIVESIQPQWVLASYGAPVDRRLVWSEETCELVHESR